MADRNRNAKGGHSFPIFMVLSVEVGALSDVGGRPHISLRFLPFAFAIHFYVD